MCLILVALASIIPINHHAFLSYWVIKLLKSIIVKVEEQGDIIRVHNDILANPDVAIDVAKKALDTLKEENEKLKLEIDETRQRGRKGNIIVTCLARRIVFRQWSWMFCHREERCL